MPLYEYRCEKCENVFSELRKSSEREAPIDCPECGGQAYVLFSTFAHSGSGGGSCSPGPGGCPSGCT